MTAAAVVGLNAEPRPKMSLSEARQVRWLRSRARPLGDLLDEGYLDTSRLEWAAQKAYDPRLKEAARVILDSQEEGPARHPRSRKTRAPAPIETPPLKLGITLEEARSTPWPFGPLKGQPMGVLSETRRVSLNNLAYLVDTDWDDRVRRAAAALLAIRLGQELEETPPQDGMVRVVAGMRSFAERRQLQLALIEGGIAGAGAALSTAYIVRWFLERRTSAHPQIVISDVVSSPESTLAFAIAVLFVAVLFVLALVGPSMVFKRIDESIEAYRRGEEGEEKVVERARRALNGEWSLYRNVLLPRRRGGDLDIVLVGPPGVWALEVKALAGMWKNVGERWGCRAGNRWRTAAKNPSVQARKGAIALADFLRADGIKTYVSAAVAWANEEGRVHVEDPIVPIWTMIRLEDELGNLGNGHRLDADSQRRIEDKLTRLCQARKNGPW